MEVARHLVQGVDLWLNNPRRPLEASGTSGQKVPINAGLNCSILDGWWCEGHEAEAGWAFGKAIDYASEEQQDDEDADALYRVLEREVLPLYYDRDRSGVPVKWFERVKSSMVKLVPRFSSAHMVCEYARRLYAPAFANGQRVAARSAALASELAAWRQRVTAGWPLVHVRSVRKAGPRTLQVEVFTGGALEPRTLRCRDGDGRECPVSARAAREAGVSRLRVKLPSPRSGPLRVYPGHPALVHPHELGLSLEVAVDRGLSF
jgi:starch phosphorylase